MHQNSMRRNIFLAFVTLCSWCVVECENEEEALRRNYRQERRAAVDRHNEEYALGLHRYTQRSVELLLGSGLVVSPQYRHGADEHATPWVPPPPGTPLPPQVDWRYALPPVKNQLTCNCCWAFAAIASLEAHNALKTRTIFSMSEQNLVDCVPPNLNAPQGCTGGYMTAAYTWVMESGGVDTDNYYPYKNKQGQCRFSRSQVAGVCRGYVDLPSGDEEALKQAVATRGPVAVGIAGLHKSFQDYRGGIYDDPSCHVRVLQDLNHAVLVVGYGTENGQDYWLIRNSWGEEWGENGYGRMARNRNNLCGIASLASYPLV